jgi:pyruvate/2-oxoglutarate/acetoin dehydrogenase E1 component
VSGGLCHSQSPESYFVHTAGLKVVMPSNPYDAKGLLISAIEDEDPVIFFEPKSIYRKDRATVPTVLIRFRSVVLPPFVPDRM